MLQDILLKKSDYGQLDVIVIILHYANIVHIIQIKYNQISKI